MSAAQRRLERNASRRARLEQVTFEPYDLYDDPFADGGIVVLDDSIQDDEAVARALQAEYEAEYRRSQYHLHEELSRNVVIPTAPTETMDDSRGNRRSRSRSRPTQELDDEEYARRLERELRVQETASRNVVVPGLAIPTAPTESIHGSRQVTRSNSNSRRNRIAPESDDEEYARRLERELRMQEKLKRDKYLRRHTPETSPANSFMSDTGPDVAVFEDEEFARRQQQAYDDEALARNLNLQEEQIVRQSRQHQALLAQQQQSRCSLMRFVCYLCPLLLMSAAAAGLLYYFVYGDEGLPNWMPTPEQFADEDPFAQKSPNEVSRWRNKGKGLELQLLNALDEKWYPFFDLAVQQWDNGMPDALTLETSRIDADSSCRSIPRTLKVCNGNYGETSWRGINKLLLEDQYIYASSARMNEYYFSDKDEDQRQYTMCHEMGHGFGLPHTDENFMNKDLGNCMDYTNRPKNNKQPSRMNYDFLAQLYGVVPGSALPDNSTETGGAVETAEEVGNPVEAQLPKEDEHHVRRHMVRETSDLPTQVLRMLDDVDDEIERGLSAMTDNNGWQLKHRSSYGEAHEKQLGDGFSVQVHFLFP